MPFTGGIGSSAGSVETDRKVTNATLTIASGEAVSDALDMRDYAVGVIFMPDTWTTADIGAKVCATEDGTYVPLKDLSNAYGTDVSIDGPVASAAYILPVYCFGAHYLKLWSHDGSGGDTNQDAERSITVILKS